MTLQISMVGGGSPAAFSNANSAGDASSPSSPGHSLQQQVSQLLQMLSKLLEGGQGGGDEGEAGEHGHGHGAHERNKHHDRDHCKHEHEHDHKHHESGEQSPSQTGVPQAASPQPNQTSTLPAAPADPATASPAQGGTPPQGSWQTAPDMSPSEVKQNYGNDIAEASQQTGVPQDVLAGMIWQESKGKPDTPGGGLMQLGPNEFQQYGGGDMSNPHDNIMAGARYMAELTQQFGDTGVALRAYNSGPNGVDPNNLGATPAGTGDPTYVDKVLGAAEAA